MDNKEIQEIGEFFKNNDLTELYIEFKGKKLLFKKSDNFNIQTVTENIVFDKIRKTAEVQSAKGPDNNKQTEFVNPKIKFIKSPITGIFYAAASPKSPAFIKVGDRVTTESVVCIIEAMKIMNEIKADMSGVVKEILVKNEQTVQEGTALFKIEID